MHSWASMHGTMLLFLSSPSLTKQVELGHVGTLWFSLVNEGVYALLTGMLFLRHRTQSPVNCGMPFLNYALSRVHTRFTDFSLLKMVTHGMEGNVTPVKPWTQEQRKPTRSRKHRAACCSSPLAMHPPSTTPGQLLRTSSPCADRRTHSRRSETPHCTTHMLLRLIATPKQALTT
jgi:hypothetical protein